MDYLWQIAGDHCRAGAKMAVAIEDATGVSKHDLRPDIFSHTPTAPTTPKRAQHERADWLTVSQDMLRQHSRYAIQWVRVCG